LRFAQTQEDFIIRVAYEQGTFAGFVWGYRLPEGKFPFLAGALSQDANYMDEIAVDSSRRGKGIGRALGAAYLAAVSALGKTESVLRTDERNTASMGLFAALGYRPIQSAAGDVRDPTYQNRVYLRRGLL
jgi:GNAT superfamily N-acetyltransferase